MSDNDSLTPDVQPALFDVVPSAAPKTLTEKDKPAPKKQDVGSLLEGWVKSRTPKKNIATMTSAVTTALDAGSNYDDIAFLLSRRHLFPSQAVFDLNDLRNAYRHLTKEKKLAEQESKARRVLSSWGSRSSVSKSALENAVSVVAAALVNGADEEKIKYAFSHRSLLASNRRVDEAMLKRALAKVDADKNAGSAASRLFQAWYDRWYEGRYTQPPGQIMALVKNALLNGIPEGKLAIAMDRMGKNQSVFTPASLQFALMQAEKIEQRREAAGAHSDLAPADEFDMMSDMSDSDDDYGEESPW